MVMVTKAFGLVLARYVRQKWPEQPVLLATGYSRGAGAIGDDVPSVARLGRGGYQSGSVRWPLSSQGVGGSGGVAMLFAKSFSLTDSLVGAARPVTAIHAPAPAPAKR